MKCPACNKDLKTTEGFRRHLQNEAFNYQKRLGFWDDYKNAQAAGYEGTPGEYAHGRMAGLLGMLGKDRTKATNDE